MYRKIWVHRSHNASGKGLPTKAYNVTKHLPTASIDPETTDKELNQFEDSIKLMVVGYTIADDPAKYSTTGTGHRDKQKEEKWQPTTTISPCCSC